MHNVITKNKFLINSAQVKVSEVEEIKILENVSQITELSELRNQSRNSVKSELRWQVPEYFPTTQPEWSTINFSET